MNTTEHLALLVNIIERVRAMRGTEQVPLGTNESVAFATIQNIQNQRRDLHQSGYKMDLRELTKNVCEAQSFSPDAEENWVLQYAYQLVAMGYFGEMRKRYAVRKRNRKLNLASQEAEYGRK